MSAPTASAPADRRPVDEALAAAWEALADRCGSAPFAHPGWLRPWAAAAPARLEALTTWRGDRLTGVLPLVWGRRWVRTPADWHTPWFEAVAEDGEALESLAAGLASLRVPRVTLDFVLEGEDTARRGAEALRRAGYRLAVRQRLRSPYLPLGGSWEAYLASFSTHRRSELRRRERRLEAAGSVALDICSGGEGLGAALDEAFGLEALGWKGRRGTAIASDPARLAFYRAVAAWAAPRGWLRLAFLRLDGRALAFDFCLETGDRHFLLKTGYHPDQAALAPGLLLRRRMVERAFALGLSSYELGGADEPWKLEWAPAARRVLAIEAFARGPAGTLAQTAARLHRFTEVQAARLARRR